MKELINNLEIALDKTRALEDMRKAGVSTQYLRKESELKEFLKNNVQF